MSISEPSDLTLHLCGPLRLVRRDGVEVTPRIAKAQAILALLGTAPALRRPRAWIQDKLWSEQPQENGSASLRQAVHRLREAVGPDRDWLTSMPGWVGLDPQRVAVVTEPVDADWDRTGDPPEFCEGLDIADPEFEDWIRDQRLAFEERIADLRPEPPAPARMDISRAVSVPKSLIATMLVAPPQADDEPLRNLADMLSSEIASGVARLGGAEIRLESLCGAPQSPTDMLRLQIRACRVGQRGIIQAVLSDPDLCAQLWTSKLALSTNGGNGMSSAVLHAFVEEVVSAATFELGQVELESSPARARYRAIGDILAFERPTLARHDQVFASTPDSPAAGIHNAWRANIRVISIMERLPLDRSEIEKEAIEFAKLSLEKDPFNPIVNAFASEVALNIENLPQRAAQLARIAVERGTSSPFAHSSLAMALARLGSVKKAHASSVHALRLAASQPNLGLWHLRCCITAIRCGRFGEATRFAQTAHELAPKLKAPLRFLAALHFYHHNEDAAACALHDLKRLETDFSLELMAAENYPVATLRESQLMAVTRSKLI